MEMGHDSVVAVSEKPIDGRLASAYGNINFHPIPGSGFALEPVALVKFLVATARGFFAAIRLMRKEKCQVAVAFGGFSSVGVGLAAAILRRPLYLHESNFKLGKATRFLAPFAKAVFIPPPLKKRHPYGNRKKFFPMAYPLRRDFKIMEMGEARAFLGVERWGKLLAVTGGSQGANVLRRWVLDNERNLAELGFHCICLVGLGCERESRQIENSKGERYAMEYVPFCDSMHALYCAADIAVCRAGAGTIAELIAASLVNVLIPLPKSAANHQMANAEAMEMEGATRIVEQRHMDRLLCAIGELSDGASCEKMRMNLRRLRSMGEDGGELLAKAAVSCHWPLL
jgi:UDP-N-acetylglucosamine--N-acetylmuramyl-(pentapeptide) pyrophosphoryl-undecaprenol N-acetylglucosamine transferase